MKDKRCFWCEDKPVKNWFVNHRQYCSKECAEKSVKDFKKNLRKIGGKRK